MSRIGKQPIQIPENVDLKIGEKKVHVKGPKGELVVPIESLRISVAKKERTITVSRRGNAKKIKALHGLIRNLIFNAIEGVINGYKKELELQGVGYRAKMQGENLVLTVGFSHPITIEPRDGIEFKVDKNTEITVSGIDKQKVGQAAAEIRKVRPPDPYKGKGVRYKGEIVKKKPGKAAKTVGIGEG